MCQCSVWTDGSPSNTTWKGEEPDESKTDRARCDLLTQASLSVHV